MLAKAAVERTCRLTKRTVDAAKPAAGRFIVWDADMAGFGLRVEPTGRKTFIARYRAGGGRAGTLRQATLGRYGIITVDEGRTLARKLLAAATGGQDPVAEKRARQQSGVTVAEVCDWYLQEAETGRLLGRRGRPIKPLTISTDRTRIKAHVKPLLGRRAVHDLSVADLEEMQAHIAMGKTAHKLDPDASRPLGAVPKGGSGVAGRTLAMLRSIFEHAVRRQMIASNPAKGARKLANQARKTRMTLNQIRALGKVMRKSDEHPTALAAVRLLALSGLRRGEVLGMKPGWILDEGGIDFPDTKTGAQVRPVGRAALKTIRAQIKRAGSDEWVFPAERGDGHFVGVPKVLARLCKAAKLPKFYPHALRHTFASVAAEIGYSELVISGLLGHAAGSVTAGYVHLDRSLVAVADRVSDTIARALDGVTGAKVILLQSVGS